MHHSEGSDTKQYLVLVGFASLALPPQGFCILAGEVRHTVAPVQ
jgi:hypothetical protein